MHPNILRLMRYVQYGVTLLLALTLVIPALGASVTAAQSPSQPFPTAPTASNTLRLPSIHNNSCGGLRDNRVPIGTQVYGDSGRTSRLFESLNQSYSHWLRVSIYWSAIEPEDVTPRQYQWSSVDAAFAAARDACLNIIATVEGTPDWAAIMPGEEGIKASKRDAFALFMAALAKRYDGSRGITVNHWEIYNEPDGRSSWGHIGAQYADMLKRVYPAVKAANPNAKIIMGGISYESFVSNGGIFVESFMRDVLAAGGGAYFDYMNFHCYPYAHSCRKRATRYSSGLVEKAATIRAMLKEYGLTKPLMLTEVGWHSNSDDEFRPSTDELQGRVLVQLLTQSIAIGSEATIWWMLEDPRPGYPYDSGLVTRDTPPQRKPAYHVYRTFIARVGRAEFLGVTSPADAPSDLEAYRFRDPTTRKIFYVAWLNPVYDLASTATKPLVVTGSKATVYNKNGAQIAVKLDADDGVVNGKVTIAVGGSPVYIVMD